MSPIGPRPKFGVTPTRVFDRKIVACEPRVLVDEFINEILHYEPEIPMKLNDRKRFNASCIGSPIKTKVVIVGESKHKVLPRKFIVKCRLCDFEEEVTLRDLASNSPEAIVEYLSRNIKALKSRLLGMYGNIACKPKTKHKLVVDVADWIDFRVFSLRDIVEKTSEMNSTVVHVDAFAVGEFAKASALKKYLVTCIPIRNPKTDELSLYITNMEPLLDDYTIYAPMSDDKEAFTRHFRVDLTKFRKLDEIKKAYERIKEKVDESLAPHIKKCGHSKLADILVLHSKMWIERPDGLKIRGWLREAKYGDTGTAKGEIERYITSNIGIGERFVGESSGRTGLLYYIDADKKQLVWGALVLNDGTLVIIEGLHGIHADEIIEHREALDQGVVKVARLATGEALARTRIICDMNPKEPIATVGIYRCQALSRLPSIKEAPDIRRWDIWVPHFIGQATPEDIAKSHFQEPLIPNDVLRKHVYLAWKSKKIVWENGLGEYIDNRTEYLLKNYQSNVLPLINNDVKNLLYRLTVAFAQLTHSYSNDFRKLRVTTQHAVLAYLFMEDNIKENEYDLYTAEERQLFKLTEEEKNQIIVKMLKTDLDMLNELKMGSMQASVIAEKIDKAESTVVKRARILKAKRLIDVNRGRRGGYQLTARGIQLLKSLLKKPSLLEKITKRDIMELEETQWHIGNCSLCGKQKRLKYSYEGFHVCEECKNNI